MLQIRSSYLCFVFDWGKGILLPTSTDYPQKAHVLLLILGVLYYGRIWRGNYCHMQPPPPTHLKPNYPDNATIMHFMCTAQATAQSATAMLATASSKSHCPLTTTHSCYNFMLFAHNSATASPATAPSKSHCPSTNAHFQHAHHPNLDKAPSAASEKSKSHCPKPNT